MEIVLLEQTRVFIFSAALGLLLGILYDLLSFFPNTFGRRFLRPLFDILYCLSFMAAFILLVLLEAGGEIRWYIPGGMVMGLVLYFVGFSAYIRALLRLLGKLIQNVGKMAQKVLKLFEKVFEYPRGN
ncbi:MAG: spore cortex biosynthesis protein YabQ [Clostridia bacterium]|nr:spore cortex biosynthesis protein YabQ [Clostridia bacterium]